MEVNSPPKRLHKHVIPVIMIAAALLVLPIIAFSRYNTTSLNTEGSVARSLVTRVLYVRPTPNGLAKVTLGSPAKSETDSNAGSSLRSNLAGAGSTAQLSLNLQTPVPKQ
jgi:hypothetical protein